MNYEDELERVRAQRSRRRQSRAAVARTADAGQAQRLGFSGGTETAGRSRSRKNSAARSQETEGQEIWTSTADPGSRAGRSRVRRRDIRRKRRFRLRRKPCFWVPGAEKTEKTGQQKEENHYPCCDSRCFDPGGCRVRSLVLCPFSFCRGQRQ